MSPDLSSLPVVRRLEDEESGLGFLLRCAHANGLSMSQLMTLAGVRTPAWPRPVDIERLAFLASVSPQQLARALRQRQTQLGRREFEFFGHRWMSVTALRVQALQICPQCLREQGYCRAVWELAGCSICLHHGGGLLDRCPHCCRPLDWTRPAVDVCRCGHYLMLADRSQEVHPAVRTWCRWLEHQCEKPLVAAGMLPQWLAWLARAGPDGAFHILMAFGVRRDAMHCQSVSETVRVGTPAEMTQCLERAFDRIADISPDARVLPRALIALIDLPRLERLARFGVLESGRHIARQLLCRMRCDAPLALLRRPWRTAPPHKGQLELF
jgi:TniQ